MPELDSPQRQAPDSLMLTGFWYRALPADRVHRNQLHQAMLLEIPLVIGRDRAGHPFALRDACPHRGMPLSCGKFDGENIECSYHGWTFDAHNGQCQHVPSLTADQNLKVERIYAGSYPCEEQDDFVWVYMPDPGSPGAGFSKPEKAPDPAPVIDKFSDKYKLAYLTADMPVSIDHGIIGLMDPAHGPFVHRAWWWRSRHSIHEKSKAFAASPYGFTMLRHPPSSNANAYRLLGGRPETEITFRLPSTRIEHIRIGARFVASLTAVTPLSDSVAEVNHAIYWNLPWLGLLSPFLRPFVKTFLNQDRRVMVMQQKGLRHDPPLMLINDADTQARWYLRLKAEYLRARAENRDFVNPV